MRRLPHRSPALGASLLLLCHRLRTRSRLPGPPAPHAVSAGPASPALATGSAPLLLHARRAKAVTPCEALLPHASVRHSASHARRSGATERRASALQRPGCIGSFQLTELNSRRPRFARHRVAGNPPFSSPGRRATSALMLESTKYHEPYLIKHRTNFCLLGVISDVPTTSSSRGASETRAEKENAGRPLCFARPSLWGDRRSGETSTVAQAPIHLSPPLYPPPPYVHSPSPFISPPPPLPPSPPLCLCRVPSLEKLRRRRLDRRSL